MDQADDDPGARPAWEPADAERPPPASEVEVLRHDLDRQIVILGMGALGLLFADSLASTGFIDFGAVLAPVVVAMGPPAYRALRSARRLRALGEPVPGWGEQRAPGVDDGPAGGRED